MRSWAAGDGNGVQGTVSGWSLPQVPCASNRSVRRRTHREGLCRRVWGQAGAGRKVAESALDSGAVEGSYCGI